ncbi:ribonucleotide reductase [Mycena vitilis]|nr:ribonucleotide reductase [Mycena vitilis]
MSRGNVYRLSFALSNARYSLVEAVEMRIRNGVTTTRISEFAIQAAIECASMHPAYSWVATHIEIANMHKTIKPLFSESVAGLQTNENTFFSQMFLGVVEQHRHVLDSAIVHLRDYDHTFIRKLQDRFLGRKDGRIVERIQHLYMRMAVAIHLDDIKRVLMTYELLSSRQINLDSFTSMYAGTTEKFKTSCYSTSFSSSDMHDMYDAVARAVFAVRGGATVAIAAQGVPCTGRHVTAVHPENNVGIYTMLRFTEGAIAFARKNEDRRTDLVNVTIEAWHIDVRSFVDFHSMHQSELSDQKSITTTISIPDIFMARVDDGSDWSLFCPRNVPELLNLRGQHFDDAYRRYEASVVPRVTVKAKDLWNLITLSIFLAGGPTVIFKDSVNGKNNLTEISPSCHSDLRTGMVDVLGDDDDLYPRNHASLALPLFVTRDNQFDFDRLHYVAREAVYILNSALDASMPELVSLLDHNKDYRCIAIGIHGLADVFAAMRLPFDSTEAADLNVRIAETMYHGALEASWELAALHGPHQHFDRTPLSNGILQYDFWDVQPTGRYDWKVLTDLIRENGVRNASLIAIGPGRGTTWASGFTDSTEPLPSNVLDGNILCPWLVEDLTKLGIWTDNMREDIVTTKGSIQHIPTIPVDIKAIYRTAWEIDPNVIIKMALGRAPFVCQSQSISFHIESPTTDSIGDLLMRAWSCGLKCGIHKLHTRFPEHNGTGSSYEDTDREMSFEEVAPSSNSS